VGYLIWSTTHHDQSSYYTSWPIILPIMKTITPMISEELRSKCISPITPTKKLLNQNDRIIWSITHHDQLFYQIVEPAHAVTSIKQSPFSCPFIENFIWIEALLKGHLS
jgi:hypothetical protein